MNYFLIANNIDNKFLESCIDRLLLDSHDDIVVLFNFLLPMRYQKIRDYPNKICMSRLRPIKYRQNSSFDSNIKEYYCNMSMIKKNQSLFKDIYFIPCPYNIEINTQEYENNIELFRYDSQRLKCFDYNPEILRKKLNYTGVGIKYQVSTGLICYDFLKSTKTNDTIILVGFTSEMTQYHECDWERNYFLNEIHTNKCYAINSYGITNF